MIIIKEINCDFLFTLELGEEAPKPKVVEKPAEKPKKVEPVVQPK